MKNTCTRCGCSVGHRGTDTLCLTCTYIEKIEKENKELKEALWRLSRRG